MARGGTKWRGKGSRTRDRVGGASAPQRRSRPFDAVLLTRRQNEIAENTRWFLENGHDAYVALIAADGTRVQAPIALPRVQWVTATYAKLSVFLYVE